MTTYMLVLFCFAGLDEIKRKLFKEMKSGDKLFVRGIMLEEMPELSNLLVSEVAVLGEKIVNDLQDSVIETYQENADRFMAEIAEEAEARKIAIDIKIIHADQIVLLKKEIAKYKPKQIWTNYSHNDFVSNSRQENKMKEWQEGLKSKKIIYYDGQKE